MSEFEPTATEALERRIDELCAEVERLRGQVASLTGRSIRMADRMDCLNDENAKLRKLMWDVYVLHRSGLDCTECPWFDECNTASGGCPWLGIFANRMCELGILKREI